MRSVLLKILDTTGTVFFYAALICLAIAGLQCNQYYEMGDEPGGVGPVSIWGSGLFWGVLGVAFFGGAHLATQYVGDCRKSGKDEEN